jgi:hypothetical protein
MGRYCKAYLASRFREYSNWTENSENVREREETADGKEVKVKRALKDDDVLYLQENYTVTDGIFLDENIIFDNVTPEWKEFCATTLEFEVPEDRKIEVAATSNADSDSPSGAEESAASSSVS